MNNRQDILNELKTLSPLLLDIKEKEKAIVVPADYFERFNEDIIAQTAHEHGILSSFKKQSYVVPELYFEIFAENVMQKIKAEENIIEKGKIIPIHSKRNSIVYLFSRVAFAASIIGFILLGVNSFNNKPSKSADTLNGISSLTQDEIYNYLYKNSHEFTVPQIQNVVHDDIASASISIDLDKQEINRYIEQNKNVLDVDDASLDIF